MTEHAVDERLIVALDVPSAAEAQQWVARFGDAVRFYKIGMELLTSGDYFRVLEWLAGQGKKVFVDLKFLDVPATVAHAVKGIAQYPVEFCTLHAQHAAMMEAAVAVKGSVKLLGVTVLTSMDAADLHALGIAREPLDQVRDRARAAQAAGLDGVVASGREAAAIRADTGADFNIVCPGIRPDGPAGDDQKRTVGVAEAFANGASHIVVGRPLRQAADPQAAARTMQAQIAAALGGLSPR